MKTGLLLLLSFALLFPLTAQVSYGTITYVQASEMKLPELDGDPDPQRDKIREMMRKMAASGAFNVNYEATFTPDGFMCKEIRKAPTSKTSELGGTTVTVRTSDRAPKHYLTDLKAGTVTNFDYVLDRSFLVAGKAEPLAWIITDETVAPSDFTLGLDLVMAKAPLESGDTIVAGFAPSLPAQVGPLNYYGLPGAIITMDVPGENDKVTTFRATSISLSPEPLTLEAPTEGKKISLEKFRSEQAKRKSKPFVIRQGR